MVAQKYRWDFIGLSTDSKPTASTSPKVTDGSTYYCSDNSKLYVWYKDRWYERKALGGGGGGGGSYTAGTGITIDDDTISVDTTTIQAKLTAGSNVTISDDTISATDTTYTAGSNVNISAENVISATDTTYSAFTGTDGTAAGVAGLVPAPATTDAGKFLKADGTWDTAGGGGGGDTVYSDKNTSVSYTGGAVYIGNLDSSQVEQPDPSTTDDHYKYFWALPELNADKPGNYSLNIMGRCSSPTASHYVALGYDATIAGSYAGGGVVIGQGASATGNRATALGGNSNCANAYSVALGGYATTSRIGEVNVGTGSENYGFNSSKYRVIGGVYDGQKAHDAATVAQGNTLATSAPTTSTVGVLGQLYTDTTNMHTYQCTAISGSTYTWTQRW